MKINLTEKYFFSNYKCEAYLINFEMFDFKKDKMFLHEEINEKIKLTENVKIENFEPLIVTSFTENISNKVYEDIEIVEFYLLDGHHRWDYAVRSNQTHKLKCVLVHYKDVKIETYNFEINTENNLFESCLKENGFQKVDNFNNSIRFKKQYFSSKRYDNKYSLYEFKRKIQKNNLIIPVGDKTVPYERLINFTPIDINDIKNLEEILPPKSTWITPRI